MELPNVETVLRQRDQNITYRVIAYRVLTEAELLAAVAAFRSAKKGRVKKNATYQIITSIGAKEAT